MIKTLKELGIEETFLHLVKSTYEKNTFNVVLNGERLKAFPPRSGVRQASPLCPLLFNIVLGVLVRTIRQAKEIKASKLEGRSTAIHRCHDVTDRKS